MANWCNNTVWFEGDTPTIERIQAMFAAMAAKETKEQCGQLPEFIQEQKGWFFNTRWEQEDVLYYETKWSPNTEILQTIADRFGAGFTHEYEETGNLVFGKAIYRNGILTDIALDEDDFNAYEHQEHTDTWLFEDEQYESDYEIMDILLERKLRKAGIQ